MTDQQLYLTVGVPSFVALMGILVNGLLYISLNSRMSALDSRMTALEARMAGLEATFTARFDLMMGKIMELDTRLSVLEDRLPR